MKTINLKNGAAVELGLLKPGDNDLLFAYLNNLTTETRSRFGPHAFDQVTVAEICSGSPDGTTRYIARDPETGSIIAYMLVFAGMIDADRGRYESRGQFPAKDAVVTFAPSVADSWQSSGLGSALFEYILNNLKQQEVDTIILWGGVQATNEKAVAFYKKFGFVPTGNFYWEEKDNIDMTKRL